MNGELYVYYWKVDDDDVDDYNRAITSIRMYGLCEDGRSTRVLRVTNFTPYVYVDAASCDADIDATKREIGSLAIMTKVMSKRTLYGFTDPSKDGDRKFLFCQCRSRVNVNTIVKKLKDDVKINGRTVNAYEYTASPRLQFSALRNIPSSGWIAYANAKKVSDTERITSCDEELRVEWRRVNPIVDRRHDERETASGMRSTDVTTAPLDKPRNHSYPLVMAFDIEANSEIQSSMPDDRADDAIFQISCVFNRSLTDDGRRRVLLTLKSSDETDRKLADYCDVREYETEAQLLAAFFDLVRSERPNVIVGYNVFGFDIPYIRRRATRFFLLNDYRTLGMNKSTLADERRMSGSVFNAGGYAASRNKEDAPTYYDWEGILIVDAYLVVMQDYKFDNFKLETVASNILGAGKDPVSYKDVFESYRTRRFELVGRYCVRDSELCLDLFEKLQMWIGLSEMASVCNVDMFSLYTQGQQMRIYSQVYAYCLRQNILVDSENRSCKNENFTGAHVFEPVTGLHENVVPFDFASLYPSVLKSNNIDYTTFVDEYRTDVDDESCRVFEWEDHINCEHDPKVIRRNELTREIDKIDERISTLMEARDLASSSKRSNDGSNSRFVYQRMIDECRESQRPLREQRKAIAKPTKKKKKQNTNDADETLVPTFICAKRRFRFVKETIRVGVLPTIITNHLECRKKTRELAKSVVDEQLKVVYEMKQLAHKKCANSMYGALGVREYAVLPLLPAAMCITYVGRRSIEQTAELIRTRWNGRVIYGDTDSNYVVFPCATALSTRELWDMAIRVADDVTTFFPPPMKLEFENAIYYKFLLLHKKQYMYVTKRCDGSTDGKIGRRGVVMARRDNFAALRNVYERLVRMIFDEQNLESVANEARSFVDDIMRYNVRTDQLVFTKSIKDCASLSDGKIGDYTVRLKKGVDVSNMSDDERRRTYIASCPAHVRLAERLRLRGKPVDAGTRIEYVVLDDDSRKRDRSSNIGKRLEEFGYFSERSDLLRIDRKYYADFAVNSIDSLLECAFGARNVVKNHVDNHWRYQDLVVNGVKTAFRPIIRISLLVAENIDDNAPLSSPSIDSSKCNDKKRSRVVEKRETTRVKKNLA